MEQAPATQADAAGSAPQQVLVSGVRPGPGLWKISKGEHVLWVFGTYAPLPRKMQWRSHQVEKILDQSQEYLYPPGGSLRVGVLKGLTLLPVLPFVIGIKNNPNGAVLRDVLSPEVYARWQVLKKKYIGDDEGIERERPMFAAQTLSEKAMAYAGLSSGKEVSYAIEAMAKKKNIKMTSSQAEMEVDDPIKAVRDFKKSPLEDQACFSKTLEFLEGDIAVMIERANAWAKGDLEAIQHLGYAERTDICDAVWLNNPVFQARPGLKDVHARARVAWIAAAERSLATNASTFATLRLNNILDPKGMVAALEAKGYVVQKPE
ncbi:MAG TPA: TraB/GumN family protein [Burkholderiales bacterium]|nr:TraB/GumN family protein [Burkholderiales bacterium]